MVKGSCQSEEFQGSIQKAQLHPIRVTQLWEMVYIDFTSIEIDMDLKREEAQTLQVLVVIDHFTCLAQAFVLLDHTAQTMAKCLHERVFPIFGAPVKLCSDD